MTAKAPSDIDRWGEWPPDVEPTLRAWNTARVLRFERQSDFRCRFCKTRCFGHRYGDVVIRGFTLCDDCAIELARVYARIEDATPPATPRDPEAG